MSFMAGTPSLLADKTSLLSAIQARLFSQQVSDWRVSTRLKAGHLLNSILSCTTHASRHAHIHAHTHLSCMHTGMMKCSHRHLKLTTSVGHTIDVLHQLLCVGACCVYVCCVCMCVCVAWECVYVYAWAVFLIQV
jgi:hypothetical protein